MKKTNVPREKFSGRHKLLKGYWNPYLMMNDKRKYAQISNPKNY